MNKYIDIRPEVREALDNKRAVVALESTIITHGMPYPENIVCAKACEAIIHNNGAVPATIAILDGRIKIGLSNKQLEYLATSENVVKCSRRDLPYVIATGLNGAATVSATMIMASLAGIRFFATGGVGGVHRGAVGGVYGGGVGDVGGEHLDALGGEHGSGVGGEHGGAVGGEQRSGVHGGGVGSEHEGAWDTMDISANTMDISADLFELHTTDVCVISAGVKSVLDIGRTLEYLETHGVPVVAYGQDDFPAFYTRESGFKAPVRLDTPEQVASMMSAKWELGMKGGAIIGNPIPEEHSLPKEEIDNAIEIALVMAQVYGIKGKEITPFLLKNIVRITKGRSLEANMHLVQNNAHLAARIAVEYSRLGLKEKH